MKCPKCGFDFNPPAQIRRFGMCRNCQRKSNPIVQKLFCKDCGKNFVHYVAGMPQEICGVCAGVDAEPYEE